MLRYLYNTFLDDSLKGKLKRRYYKGKKTIADYFFGYGIEELKNKFIEIGIKNGDTLLVHSSFNIFNGFRGKAQDIINCLIEILGKDGNLLMVSMPYMSSSYDYLQKGEAFDVRRTPSKMGLISEIFRRKRGVLRSLHPTHPVLAYGKDSAWLVEGHEACKYPCGKNTPFDKFRSLNGKILFYDVPFNRFTFIHYIEDMIASQLPFLLYSKEPIAAKVMDCQGKEVEIKTYVFGEAAVQTRNPDILEKYLFKQGVLRNAKIGKTKLMFVNAEDAVVCTYKMLENNVYFYTREARNEQAE